MVYNTKEWVMRKSRNRPHVLYNIELPKFVNKGLTLIELSTVSLYVLFKLKYVRSTIKKLQKKYKI